MKKGMEWNEKVTLIPFCNYNALKIFKFLFIDYACSYIFFRSFFSWSLISQTNWSHGKNIYATMKGFTISLHDQEVDIMISCFFHKGKERN